MKIVRTLAVLVILAVLSPTACLFAQDSQPSLGDLARSLRKKKEEAPPAPAVIDNDNFSQVMDAAQANRQAKTPVFSFDNGAKTFKISSPDVTCSLSFSAQATSLISDPFASRDLPASELAKLDGPAAISDGTLQVSVFNASNWSIKEITVGLTILRKTDPAAGNVLLLYGGSVKADNARALFASPDIDGGLVGGASLNATEFLTIARA